MKKQTRNKTNNSRFWNNRISVLVLSSGVTPPPSSPSVDI
jgi:hypothetical protein